MRAKPAVRRTCPHETFFFYIKLQYIWKLCRFSFLALTFLTHRLSVQLFPCLLISSNRSRLKVCVASLWHLAEPFFRLLDFGRRTPQERLHEMTRCLLSICGMLLGYSFGTRPNNCALTTAGPFMIMTTRLSINGLLQNTMKTLLGLFRVLLDL